MQHGSAGKGSQLRLPHVPTSNRGLFPPSSGLAAKGPGSDVGLCTGRGGGPRLPPDVVAARVEAVVLCSHRAAGLGEFCLRF